MLYNFKNNKNKNKLYIFCFYIINFIILNILYTSIFFLKIMFISIYLNMGENKNFINFLLYFIVNYEKQYKFEKILYFCNYYMYFIDTKIFNN